MFIRHVEAVQDGNRFERFGGSGTIGIDLQFSIAANLDELDEAAFQRRVRCQTGQDLRQIDDETFRAIRQAPTGRNRTIVREAK